MVMSRRTRTVLTVLGIAVSVGAMVALLSVSRRFSAAMEESFRQRGVDLVVLSGGVIDQLSSDIDEKVSNQIAELPGVKFVTPGLIELVEVERGGSNISVLIQGWPEENFAHHDLRLIAGSWLDYKKSGQVLLGADTAANLKKSVGDKVVIK